MNFFSAIDKSQFTNIAYGDIPIMTYGLIGITTLMLAIVTIKDLKSDQIPETGAKETVEQPVQQGEIPKTEGGKKKTTKSRDKKNHKNTKKSKK